MVKTNASFHKMLKPVLENVHFGLSPESDTYITNLYLKNIRTNETMEYDNIGSIVSDIIDGNVIQEDVDLDSITVVFSENLYTVVEKEYKQYSVS